MQPKYDPKFYENVLNLEGISPMLKARAFVFLTLAKLMESIAAMDFARSVRHANPADAVVYTSMLFAAGWAAMIGINPHFFRDNSYMASVDPLAGFLFVSFSAVAVASGLSLFLTRGDRGPDAPEVSPSSPERHANQTPVFLIRLTGFLMSAALWPFVVVITNLAFLTSDARTIGAGTFVYLSLGGFSLLYVVKDSISYAAAVMRRRNLIARPPAPTTV